MARERDLERGRDILREGESKRYVEREEEIC